VGRGDPAGTHPPLGSPLQPADPSSSPASRGIGRHRPSSATRRTRPSRRRCLIARRPQAATLESPRKAPTTSGNLCPSCLDNDDTVGRAPRLRRRAWSYGDNKRGGESTTASPRPRTPQARSSSRSASSSDDELIREAMAVAAMPITVCRQGRSKGGGPASEQFRLKACRTAKHHPRPGDCAHRHIGEKVIPASPK